MDAPLYIVVLEGTLLPFLRAVYPDGHRFMADCFTDWPDIFLMGCKTTTFHLIQVMRQSFVALPFQTYCGLMVVHNLRPNCSKIFLSKQ